MTDPQSPASESVPAGPLNDNTSAHPDEVLLVAPQHRTASNVALSDICCLRALVDFPMLSALSTNWRRKCNSGAPHALPQRPKCAI
ncbi:MAG: hypothetical protein K0Q61_524 [Rhodococcus erythropolis]|jgi:hypothetical protein|nr:hypothetical protein [Rhodococcus erythropolis]